MATQKRPTENTISESQKSNQASKRQRLEQRTLSMTQDRIRVEDMPQRPTEQPARVVPNPPQAAVKLEDSGLYSFADISTSINKKSISAKDLPLGCQVEFRSPFRPKIRELCGMLPAWNNPSEADVDDIWNNIFPDHQLQGSEILSGAVYKIVEHTAQYWRSNMAKTAVNHLKVILKTSFTNDYDRLAHAAWLLGDDGKDRKHPFYYKEYSDDTPRGIFQSPLVTATLATHLASISTLPEAGRLKAYPSGALALAILTVKRALTWAKTGVYSIPKTPEGHFSRANWGDHFRLEDGKYIVAKTSSLIDRVVSKLSDSQWRKILEAAEEFKKPDFTIIAV